VLLTHFDHPLQALPAFATLLPEPRLRPALLQGLAMGLGGLDAQLAAAGATALTRTLSQTEAAELSGISILRSGSGNLPATYSGHQVQVEHQAAAERLPDASQQPLVQIAKQGNDSNSSGSIPAADSLLRAVLGDLPSLWQQTRRCMSPPAR
jgi:hypothetical protein